jgi:hypothetical protein
MCEMNLANPPPICKLPIPFPFAFFDMKPVETEIAIAFVRPERDAYALAVAAQTEPREHYVAAQHPSARTWQVYQWAAAQHTGSADDTRYAWSLEDYQQRLAADPQSLGYPPGLDTWPPNRRAKCLADCAGYAEATILESDHLVANSPEPMPDPSHVVRYDTTIGDEPWIPERKRKGNGGAGGEEISLEFSEDRLALRFVDRHGDALRYVAAWGKWLAWTDSHWEIENTLAAFDKARKICREAAAQCNKASTAHAIAKGKTVSAVETIARSDRRVALTSARLDIRDEVFNTPMGSALLGG